MDYWFYLCPQLDCVYRGVLFHSSSNCNLNMERTHCAKCFCKSCHVGGLLVKVERRFAN